MGKNKEEIKSDRLNIPIDAGRVKTGRRKAVDIDLPRDKTLCFMVSDEEKSNTDLIGAAIKRTRSALLAKIVNSFVAGVMAEDNWNIHADELSEFMLECRDELSRSNNPLIKRQ